MIAVVSTPDLLVAFGIVAFIVLGIVYAWTDLGDLIAEKHLDELWDCACGEINTRHCPVHGVSERDGTGSGALKSAVEADCPKPSVSSMSRSLTSSNGRAAVREAGADGSSVGAGACICNPRWTHVSDADCPIHGLASLCRSIVGVYDQEQDYAHLNSLIDQVRA